MLKRFFRWLFGWNKERERLLLALEAAQQDVSDAWKEADLSRNCPCLHTTPCDERCTCKMPYSSRGCSRCAMYGSDGQRKLKAARLAAKIDLEFSPNTVSRLRRVAKVLRDCHAPGSVDATALERMADQIESVQHAAPEGWTEEDFKREFGHIPIPFRPESPFDSPGEPEEPAPQSNIRCVKRADLEDSMQSEGFHLP